MSQKNKYGWTPLHIAIAERKEDMAMLLLENGADINIQDNEGYAPLHYAMLHTQLNVAKVIIEKDSKTLGITSKYDEQPLWIAVKNAKVPEDFLEYLLQNGADKNYGISGSTPYDLIKDYDIKELTELFEKY